MQLHSLNRHETTKTLAMATARFGNASTASTRSSALSSFENYLRENGLSSANVRELVKEANGGIAFCRVMDRYALHLVTSRGTRGKVLSEGTAKLYYSAVKNWFYDIEPTLQATCDRKLKSIAGVVSKEFKRKSPVPTKQAPPCTKMDLGIITSTVLQHAGSEADYWDAALMAVMWHIFGRSSDMISLTKAGFAVHPGGALTMRLERMKTSLQQGLALFADMNALTCPVTLIAVAAVADMVPSIRIFRQLPELGDGDSEHVDEDEMPLLDFLQDHIEETFAQVSGVRRPPGIHSYINRVLRRVEATARAGGSAQSLTPKLSSHSFRRGGAQAANATPQLSLQWILDRGGWQLSHLNKAFEYLMNTTLEDQKFAKYLSGIDPDDSSPWIPNMSLLDPHVLAGARAFQRLVFHIPTTPEVDAFHFRADVLDMLTGVVIYHYPDLVKLQRESLFHRRVLTALGAIGYTENDILAWSLQLRHSRVAAEKPPAKTACSSATQCCSHSSRDDQDDKAVKALLADQVELLKELITRNSQLELRIARLESAPRPQESAAVASPVAPTPTLRTTVRERAPPQNATDVWFMWYAEVPPLWDTKDPSKRQRFHDKKMLVAYMRLFLPRTYTLDRSQGDYHAHVLHLGSSALNRVQEFLRDPRTGSSPSSVGTIVKAMKRQDDTGRLDERKKSFATAVRAGQITDPTPVEHLVPWKGL